MSPPKKEYPGNKSEYLASVHRTDQTSHKSWDSRRPPSNYSEARERHVHAEMLHDIFAGKIDMTIGQWTDYLAGVVKDPQHSYRIPGREVSPDDHESQYMLALLGGQASGKSALKAILKNKGTIDTDKSVTVSTSFFLERFPELKGLGDDINAKENAIASVRNEILYLQKLVTNVALANGLSAILDIHIIEERQAQELTQIAHKNKVPSVLISPHVTLETYGRRVAERAVKEKRDAFKPEHILFHQIFADNFENHFKHMFDLSLLLDNNKDITDKTPANEQALKPIYRAIKMEDGISEDILDAQAYADFKAKIHIKPRQMQNDIDNIMHQPKPAKEESKAGVFEPHLPAESPTQEQLNERFKERIEAVKKYITRVSNALPRQRVQHAAGVAAERGGENISDSPEHNTTFRRFLDLQKPSGWEHGGKK